MAETTDQERETREPRETYPSGLMALMKNESIAYILDALLDAAPHREFNQSELARTPADEPPMLKPTNTATSNPTRISSSVTFLSQIAIGEIVGTSYDIASAGRLTFS